MPEDGLTPRTQGETMEIGTGRRLNLAPQALLVEARNGAQAWVPARVMEYDEIAAAYRYSSRDYAVLGVAGGIWAAVLALLGIIWLVAQWPALIGVSALLVGSLLVAGAGAHRFLTIPRRLLRIEALGGSLVVPDRSPAFFPSLAERLPRPAAPPTPARATPAFGGEPTAPAAPGAPFEAPGGFGPPISARGDSGPQLHEVQAPEAVAAPPEGDQPSADQDGD